MPTVRIVVPPVLSVVRPNLGVGLLRAALSRDRISCDVSYANIWFAELIGGDPNELLAERIDTRPLLAEWLFSFALYPQRDAERDQKYVQYAQRHVDREILEYALARVPDIQRFVTEAAVRILDGEPKIVGISTSFQQNTAALALGRELKSRRPELILCMGGANCEGVMGEAIARNFPFVDRVFAGEADVTFPDFVRSALTGLMQLGASRVVHGTPIEDLDRLPTPEYEDFFRALDETGLLPRVRPALVFESSRGCWWGAKHHCKFCGLNGTSMRYRSKSPARVRRELTELNEAWHVDSFMAADNIINNEMIDGLLVDLAKSDAPYSLFYEIKSNLNYEKLATLAAAGVRWIQPGIESLDDEVLSMMDKGVTALLNVRLLRNCAELGIIPIWNLLTGFPEEGDKHFSRMAQLVPLLEHLSPPRGPFQIRLDRFSPYFERAAEFGFAEARPMIGYSAIYDLPANEIRDLAYFFEDPGCTVNESPAFKTWCDNVAAWRERHFSERGPAALSLMDIAGIGIVHDTRRISRQEYAVLDELDLQIIRHFRDPRTIPIGLEQLCKAGGWPEAIAHKAFDKLVLDCFIACDGEKAISLPLDYAYTLERTQVGHNHPFGELKSTPIGAGIESGAKAFNRGHD